MDFEKLIEAVRLCGSTPKVDQCKRCAYWDAGDMSRCIPNMTGDAATALSMLRAENEELRAELNDLKSQWDMYGGDGGLTMKRLTKIYPSGSYGIVGDIDDAVHRLAAIEDILGDEYDLERLREMVQAKREGRLHIFPVKIGETVWFEDPDDVIRSEKIERYNAYTCTETIGFENSDIGKYVFFSREAAEAALKGEQDG